MATPLEQCFYGILCALGGTVLNALQSLITTGKSLLLAEVTELQLQIVQYDILATPLRFLQGLALDAIDKAEKAASLLPIDLIGGCVGVGNLSQHLTVPVHRAVSKANEIIDDLARLLSYQATLQATVDGIHTVLEELTQAEVALATCGN